MRRFFRKLEFRPIRIPEGGFLFIFRLILGRDPLRFAKIPGVSQRESRSHPCGYGENREKRKQAFGQDSFNSGSRIQGKRPGSHETPSDSVKAYPYYSDTLLLFIKFIYHATVTFNDP
jgi:hypothetical protein